jgi:hypothetical protein
MSRSLLTRLSGLDSSLPADPSIPTVAEIATLKRGMLDLLLTTYRVKPVAPKDGPKSGVEKDPNWDKDIANIIDRIAPHTIFAKDPITNLLIAVVVSVKPASIQAEVDDNGEVCAWIYEES